MGAVGGVGVADPEPVVEDPPDAREEEEDDDDAAEELDVVDDVS